MQIDVDLGQIFGSARVRPAVPRPHALQGQGRLVDGRGLGRVVVVRLRDGAEAEVSAGDQAVAVVVP